MPQGVTARVQGLQLQLDDDVIPQGDELLGRVRPESRRLLSL